MKNVNRFLWSLRVDTKSIVALLVIDCPLMELLDIVDMQKPYMSTNCSLDVMVVANISATGQSITKHAVFDKAS